MRLFLIIKPDGQIIENVFIAKNLQIHKFEDFLVECLEVDSRHSIDSTYDPKISEHMYPNVYYASKGDVNLAAREYLGIEHELRGNVVCEYKKV